MKSSKAKPQPSSAARLPTGSLDFGARMRKFRLAATLTQAQLGERVGITKGAISSFEKGNTHPSIHTVGKIAKALGVDMTMMLAGHGAYQTMQPIIPGMSIDDRVRALPPAMQEFVILALKRAEAAAKVVPEKFLRSPTSENWAEFAAYLESISMKSGDGDP